MKHPIPGTKAHRIREMRERNAANAETTARRSTGGATPPKPINAPVEASAPAKETTMKKAKKKPAKPAAKKRGRSEAAANLRAAKAVKPRAERTTVPALEVAAFVCRDGGASMEELVKAFGIEAHPMRAKIHYVRHKLGYSVETKDGRYRGTAPKAKAA